MRRRDEDWKFSDVYLHRRDETERARDEEAIRGLGAARGRRDLVDLAIAGNYSPAGFAQLLIDEASLDDASVQTLAVTHRTWWIWEQRESPLIGKIEKGWIEDRRVGDPVRPSLREGIFGLKKSVGTRVGVRFYRRLEKE